MRIVRNTLNIFLLILLLSILINPAYSKPALRAPINTDKTQIRIDSVLDKDLRFMFKGNFFDRIIVFRNKVRGKPKGQVEMRVCEISELSNEERLSLIEAFNRWLTDYPGIDRDGVIHKVTIRSILDMLRLSDSQLKEASELTRVYIAISDPELNGKSEIDVEGFVVVADWKYKNKYPVVVCWETKPENRDVALDHILIPKWLLIRRPKRKFRFIGIGRQILCYAVWRELNRGCDILVFKFYEVEDKLSAEGLKARVPYSSSELIEYIRRRKQKTFEYLEASARSNDNGAKEILDELMIHRRNL